jgi:hypothetical protein
MDARPCRLDLQSARTEPSLPDGSRDGMMRHQAHLKRTDEQSWRGPTEGGCRRSVPLRGNAASCSFSCSSIANLRRPHEAAQVRRHPAQRFDLDERQSSGRRWIRPVTCGRAHGALLMRFGFIAHREFKSRSLRHAALPTANCQHQRVSRHAVALTDRWVRRGLVTTGRGSRSCAVCAIS